MAKDQFGVIEQCSAGTCGRCRVCDPFASFRVLLAEQEQTGRSLSADTVRTLMSRIISVAQATASHRAT